MLDEIRDHDPLPTEEEQRWMALDTLGLLARVVAFATVALVVGWSSSLVLDDAAKELRPAVAHR